MSKTVLFQTIQFRTQKQFFFKQFSLAQVPSFNVKKLVPFQTIQFSISIQFSSIWPIERTHSCATTLGQNGLVSNSNEGILCIFQSSSFTEASSSDCLESNLEHSSGRSSCCILQPKPTGQYYFCSRYTTWVDPYND